MGLVSVCLDGSLVRLFYSMSIWVLGYRSYLESRLQLPNYDEGSAYGSTLVQAFLLRRSQCQLLSEPDLAECTFWHCHAVASRLEGDQ